MVTLLTRIRHIERFRRLMHHHALIRDLITGFVPSLPDSLALDQVQPLGRAWRVSDVAQRMEGRVWLVRDDAGQPDAVLLLECLSAYDPKMGERMEEYVAMLARDLERNVVRRADGSPVLLAPLVFFAGPRPWASPWYLNEWVPAVPGMLSVMRKREGQTLDIHAYARGERPPANLVSCMIALELERYRWSQEPDACLELTRCLRQELKPLLATAPDALQRDFAAYVHAGVAEAMPDAALPQAAAHSFAALESAVVARAAAHLMKRNAGNAEAQAQDRTDFVQATWGLEAGQVFRQRLAALPRAAWPTLTDLLTAFQAGREPLARVDPSGNGQEPT